MSRLRDCTVRLVNLFRRGRLERELDAELQAYLELDVEENIRQGMAPKEARRTALARLGGVETVKEQCRDVQRFRVADDLWRDLRLSEFGGDPSALGRAITINGSPFTVVGVAPVELASTQGIFRVDVWFPLAFEQLVRLGDVRLQELRGARGYSIVGRLREGVGIGDARTLLEVVAGGLHQSYPDEWTALSGQPRAFTIRGANEARLPFFVAGSVVGGLAVLTGLVLTLLLIVCASISGLLLADASVRHREMSIRQALGASRLRLLRQVVVESLGLGLVGGCLGVAAAAAAMRFVALLLPDLPVPLQLDLELRWRLCSLPLWSCHRA